MNKLKPEDVIVGVKIPIEITSLDRFQQLLNDQGFRERHKIEVLGYEKMSMPLDVKLGPLYLRQGTSIAKGYGDACISDKPLAVGYLDGGLEYLSQFFGSAYPDTKFECNLWIPNIETQLTYRHPIKDQQLLDILHKERFNI
ncbi:hypothetical protein ACFL0X_02105 [Nanoarchaeota archaeon]